MSKYLNYFTPFFIIFSLILLWQVLVFFGRIESFILPSPYLVLLSITDNFSLLLYHSFFTLSEILLGLIIGFILGTFSGIILAFYGRFRRLLLPIFVISQALPVFALAPLLTLWLGYGMASKVAMASIIIFFPVTSATHDGLRHYPYHLRILPHLMEARLLPTLLFIRLPSSLPSIAAGVRIATVTAPIGAIVGEWVGSAKGLGFIMLHANARVQTDLMFAALIMLIIIALSLYKIVDLSLHKLIFWQQDKGINQTYLDKTDYKKE